MKRTLVACAAMVMAAPALTQPPTFVATTDEEVDIMSNVDFFVAGVYAVGASSAQVRTRTTSVNLGFYGTRVNEMFHFIAIGPR